jgi:hypothetical protein
MLPPNLYARVRFLYAQLHTRPRVRRALGLPCALTLERAAKKMQTSDAMRRENADTHAIVVTAKAGVPVFQRQQ